MFSMYGPAHVCGLHYVIGSDKWNLHKHFLPQVQLEAKATILATTSKTVLTQTFVNPSTEKAIKECRYTFPLYDGVSVVGFTCHVGGREIVGEVKEREKARAVFQDAVSKGETAGLFEQLPDASDVFTTTVGNIPPGAKVIIAITYLGELKHDMEVDGIRFTIPNIICPRYGDYPGTLCRSSATDAMGTSISITVDADMADGSLIRMIQSPTHPISVTMGSTSFASANDDPVMTKASATLALNTAGLDKDFVLQVIAKYTGVPKAILETHPRIPNHRAVMATLVPKFALPPARPEIVFVCDRSGSMQLTRIELAKQALKVFLKSLPIGVKFNICSFGSSHSFLWEKSASYNQQTLDAAMNHVDSFAANYGGTEMLQPLQATIERRYKDMDLDIMLLTDGEDWGQDRIFSYLNESIQATKASIRVFTLGVGNGVSHAMIEGIAKAGNGFSQSVGENEPMNAKVVRMLKGALSPHIHDYTMEVKYSNDEISAHLDVEPEDDFEIVEKVSDSLKVKLDLKEQGKPEPKSTKTPISLFDPHADPDAEEPTAPDATGESRYAHLPTLPTPKILQAPQTIPSLFPFHRTSIYLLLGPSAPQGTPTSLTLRGTSPQGPLELEIPIQSLAHPGETIHQLAAKKAISELEQGRGWLAEATDETGELVKKKCEGRYEDMVEREAVRLGVQFQVGGKWCSFVAVESNAAEAEAQRKAAEGWQWMDDKVNAAAQQVQGQSNQQSVSRSLFGAAPPQGNSMFFGGGGSPVLGQCGPPVGAMFFGGNTSSTTAFGASNSMVSGGLFGSANTGGGSLFGSANAGGGAGFGSSNSSSGGGLFGGGSSTSAFGSANSTGGGLFGNSFNYAAYSAAPPPSSTLFGAVPPPPPPPGTSSLFSAQGPVRPSVSCGAPAPAPAQTQHNSGTSLFGAPAAPPATGDTSLRDYQSGLMLLEQQNKKRLLMARQELDSPDTAATAATAAAADPQLPSPPSDESLLHYLISLQSFEGSWSLKRELLGVLGLDEGAVKAQMDGVNDRVVATALVIAVFEARLEGLKGSWELVGDKGRAWLEGEVGDGNVEEWVQRGKKVLAA
ncbi:von Willebrand factor type A domain-containing protein [Bipolaris maydis]|nr:von Willebrand factor type A domain-containing protein [Bipolaris maydis]